MNEHPPTQPYEDQSDTAPIEIVSKPESFLITLVGTLLFLPIAIAVGFVLGYLATSFGVTGISGGIVGLTSGLFALIILALFPFVQRQRAKRIAKQLVQSLPEDMPAEEVMAIFQSKRPILSQARGIETIAHELALFGREEAVARVCRDQDRTAIGQLEHAIEPIQLDETDSAFTELINALDGNVVHVVEDSGDSSLRTTFRRISRNVVLKDGSFISMILIVLFILSMIRLFYKGRASCGTVILTISVLSLIFRPASKSLADDEWFLVNGGVLIRPSFQKSDENRYLITRDYGSLVVSQIKKRKWRVFVTDGEEKFDSLATRNEVDLLLRAWYSPVDPPDEERIGARSIFTYVDEEE